MWIHWIKSSYHIFYPYSAPSFFTVIFGLFFFVYAYTLACSKMLKTKIFLQGLLSQSVLEGTPWCGVDRKSFEKGVSMSFRGRSFALLFCLSFFSLRNHVAFSEWRTVFSKVEKQMLILNRIAWSMSGCSKGWLVQVAFAPQRCYFLRRAVVPVADKNNSGTFFTK